MPATIFAFTPAWTIAPKSVSRRSRVGMGAFSLSAIVSLIRASRYATPIVSRSPGGRIRTLRKNVRETDFSRSCVTSAVVIGPG